MYFRSEAVLDLPVSTTSYSRHAVSTIQTRSRARQRYSPQSTQTGLDIRNPVLLPYPISHQHPPSGLNFSIHPILIPLAFISNIKGHPISREQLEITRLLPSPI